MKKNLIFIGIIGILIIAGIFYWKSLTEEEKIPEEITMPKKLEGKKVVMIVAFRNFRDEEYFIPKEILESAGAEVKTASNKKGTAIGADGGDVQVDFLVSEVNPAEFDAIVFIGGPGCLENLDNEDSYNLAQTTVSQNKVLASICISPAILAKAGVLKGKRATVWSSALDKSTIEILEENEAIYEDKSVVQDGKIITANGPGAAKKFGQKIVELLTE